MQSAPRVLTWPPTDKLPDISIEAAHLFLDGEEGVRVLDGGRDLQSVSHDTGVGQQALNFAWRVASDTNGVEAVKDGPIVSALPQNGVPTQTGLRSFEDEKLEQRPVVV